MEVLRPENQETQLNELALRIKTGAEQTTRSMKP
jgi:hypothetical protein